MTDILTAPAVTARPVATAFDAMSDDYYRDPAVHFAKVRDENPVFWYDWLNAWIVTRREDVLTVLSDWTEFSSAANTATIDVPERFQHIVPPGLMAQLIVGMDPDEHTLHRNIALRGFTKARMEELRPQIEERAHRILDKIQQQGAANIMAEYCLELTTQTLLAHLGLGWEYDDLMRRLRGDMGRVLSSAQEEMPVEVIDEVWEGFSGAFAEMSAVVAERRENPGTDFISEMAVQRGADGEYALTVPQIAIKICEFAMAGTDSTAQAMTNAILFLSKKTEYIDEAIAEPSLWANVFEETVRRRPSAPFASRQAMRDLELSGVKIAKGDMIWVALASANTEAAHYDAAFDFDIHRENPTDHLAFTMGRHTCLGQELARVQGATGLKVLFERLPSLRPEQDFPLEFIKMALLPVRTSLPVVWDVADIEKAKKNVKRDMSLTVVSKTDAADGVAALALRHPDGDVLPEWLPGAHVDVAVPIAGGGVVVRQYSLSSPANERSEWRLGILREVNGRGGSLAVHDVLAAGDSIRVGWPRNNFHFLPSKRYVFVAGGIGITPMLPMIAAAEAAGAEWELHYGGRSRRSMAFIDEIAGYGDRAHLVPQDEFGHLDLSGIFAEVQDDTLVYACGPEPLLKALEGALAHWPEDTLHTERFAPKKIERTSPDTEFEVEFATSGLVVTVPVGVSILDAAEKAGLTTMSSCREGTCGTCETPILKGEADHRDSILTPKEQERGESMMICVSRAMGNCPRLVLDA